MRFKVDFQRRVQDLIVVLFLFIMLGSQGRDPQTGELLVQRFWVSAFIFIGVAVVFFRDTLNRMGYRGDDW
jgi:hypothetical protein